MRRKYIKFLRRIKTPRQSLEDTFGKICTDQAIFRHFNWTSNKSSQSMTQRESLQHYWIFTDCLFEAWSSHGLAMETLKSKMASVIKRIYVRNNVRNFRARSKIVEL
ncbi:uncharacterized protein LOC134285796 [Aedes albopictus]|uniref:DUF4806 domain-containing protein n=1 Tax=Aedes albopictus TaxID=7160 RepID=A0ABM1ZPH1_AEDAL